VKRRPRIPASRREPFDGNPIAAVVAAARLRGCTCDPPDVVFERPPAWGEIAHVQVGHDDGCPILDEPEEAA
jgi:hypothetical protein